MAVATGTTFDLLRTTGSSIAVLGVFLLLLQHSGRLVAQLALVFATLWQTFVGRGPLEALAATVARAFRGTS